MSLPGIEQSTSYGTPSLLPWLLLFKAPRFAKRNGFH
jgi:hypothetical protein